MVATTLPSVAAAGIAAGTSQRRLKKLGFKQLLTIQRGSSGNGLALLGATESAIENDDQQDRGLGVDASEVTEHHLQAALSSTQLASDVTSQDPSKPSSSSNRPAYHIPTPEAKSILTQVDYSILYPSGAYFDPVTYVRSSDTVEQCSRGPDYCMDEDDNDWLEERNTKAAQAIAAALKNVKSPTSNHKGKSKEKTREEMIANLIKDNVKLKVITCEEYEMVITVFEQVCADKVPFAHLDLSKLPTMETFSPYFEAEGPFAELALPELPLLPWEQSHHHHHHQQQNGKTGQVNGVTTSSSREHSEWSPNNPYRNLQNLKQVAEIIYPFWKERREERSGKMLVPALNLDESNENDPYVCFRRREVKTIRKTRKTDVLHLEKLVKLRLEMQQAVTLMTLMAQREKTKRSSLMHDRLCWQTTREFLEVKRQWNIQGPNAGQEDEELMAIDKRDEMHGVAGAASRKKRRVEEGAAAAAAMAAQGMAVPGANGIVKLSSKKMRPEDAHSMGSSSSSAAAAAAAAAAASSSSVGLGSAISDRVQAVQAYIERECQRKAEGDMGWEEGSDSAFQPMLVPAHLRNFRPIQAESETSNIPWSNKSPSNATSFSSSNNLPRAGRPASFRRRLGRGGRIFLDRRLPTPSPVPSNLSDWPRPETNRRETSTQQQQQSSTFSQGDSRQSSEKETKGKGKRTRPWQLNQQTPLTGPFAFSPSIRPNLLNSTSSLAHIHAIAEVNVDKDTEEDNGNIGDVSSPNSSSTQQSRISNATTAARATSTQPTEIEEAREEEEQEDYGAKQTERDDAADISSDEEEEEDEEDWQDAQERWNRLRERWRYDDEGGRWAGLGLCGLGGMEDDDEAIIDDFDQRFMRFRMTLLEESDLMKLSTDLTNVMQAQQAADAPPAQPNGYAIFRGENPSMFHQQQAQAAAQQQLQQQQNQRQQALVAQQAAANLAAANTSNLAPHLQGPVAAAAAAAMAMPSNPIARAVQTNVGGPLTALQQQQQLHQAQLQMALHQQQQRAAAAQAQAQAQAAAMVQQQQQNQGSNVGSSPVPRPRSSQQIGMPHPLSQSFGNAPPGGLITGGNGNVGTRYPMSSNGQSPSPFPNGMMSSPQMQAHLSAAGGLVGNGAVTAGNSSASPASQHRSSPHMSNSASFHSSPAQKHAMPMSQQQQQQQAVQQQRGGNATGGFVGNGNGVMPQMNPLAAAAALQQAQAALQAQQQQNAIHQQAQQQQHHQQQGANQSTHFSNQLLAMHAALTQSQSQNGGQLPMQLKLPANRTRALEIAQQAAKLAAAAQQGNGALSPASSNNGNAQMGMGILSNLQQQMNLAQQQQQQQQHNFAAMNAAVSGASNTNNPIMANVNSPKAKGRN